MRLTAPAIGAAIVGVAITVVWYSRPSPEATGGSEIVLERTPAPADAAVNTPPIESRGRAEAFVDTAVPAAEPIGAATGSAPIPAPVPLPGETAPTPMAQLFESRQEQAPPGLAQREREFAAESVDDTWAPGAETVIFDRFAQMPGVALITLQVECRSTMCRLQAASPNLPGAVTQPFNILVDPIGLEPRWAVSIVDDSGTLHSVAYLWRDGMAPESAPGQSPEENWDQ